ncbi:helix-turn-helix domain-containing protein [Veronia pacifica]|uniref:HTH araC/xylS-type domain-containing protein n=1 Tax=Veronia pacifica TaxID=1080227 RepID=A0A1C3ES61_9GAMM|nr:AraC family transcriptional regulator [Veronia pacifica]ODA36064.1 hypothetical protein A8L45_00195 [Veronia pacifica]
MGITPHPRIKLLNVPAKVNDEESENQLIKGTLSSMGSPLVKGELTSYRHEGAFSLHAGRVKELDDMQVLSSVTPAVMVTFLLEGSLSFGYDDHDFHLDASSAPCGIMANVARPSAFTRRLRRGNRTAKLNLMLYPSWVRKMSSNSCAINRFIEQHHASLSIVMTPELLVLCEQLISLDSPAAFSERVKMESLVYQTIGELVQQVEAGIFPAFTSTNAITVGNGIEKIISHIENNLAEPLELASLAAHFAMSVSSFQRKCREHLGMPVNAYIRQRRLDMAKQCLESGLMTITEAAYQAGYHHPSNFTNAFRRAFGHPPSFFADKADVS